MVTLYNKVSLVIYHLSVCLSVCLSVHLKVGITMPVFSGITTYFDSYVWLLARKVNIAASYLWDNFYLVEWIIDAKTCIKLQFFSVFSLSLHFSHHCLHLHYS